MDKSATSDNTANSHWDFTIHSNCQTKNKKYSLLAFINLADRNINDQGGLILEQNTTLNRPNSYDEMLELDGNKPILTTAISRDKSYNLHLYHEYVGYKAFQFYQNIDVQTRKIQFGDKGFAKFEKLCNPHIRGKDGDYKICLSRMPWSKWVYYRPILTFRHNYSGGLA